MTSTSTLRMQVRNERVNTGTVTGVDNNILEMDTNSEFTDYITRNYEKLVSEAPKFNILPELAADLINDVWRSYKEGEENGHCYDMSKGNRDGYITVEQSVYGRIKGYSRNRKYHAPNEAHAKDAKGKYIMKEIASSATTGEIDQLSGCQKQYAMMSSYDELDSVEDKVALAENMDYLLSFGEQAGMPLLSAIETIVNMGDSLNIKNIDLSIFDGIRGAGSELKEAFVSVFKCAANNVEYFEYELENARERFDDMASCI